MKKQVEKRNRGFNNNGYTQSNSIEQLLNKAKLRTHNKDAELASRHTKAPTQMESRSQNDKERYTSYIA